MSTTVIAAPNFACNKSVAAIVPQNPAPMMAMVIGGDAGCGNGFDKLDDMKLMDNDVFKMENAWDEADTHAIIS